MRPPSLTARAEEQDNRVYLVALALYALPCVSLSLINIRRFSAEAGWGFFTSGLFLTLAGTIALVTYLRTKTPQNTYIPSATATPSSNPELEELQEKLSRVMEDAREKELSENRLRKEAVLAQDKVKEMVEELAQYKEEAQQQFQHKEALLKEYLNTIGEQRALIEKKQQYVVKLENKVHDLSYEIKTLLQLENLEPKDWGKAKKEQPLDHPVMELFSSGEQEGDPGKTLAGSSDPKVQTPHDAALHLQKCVEIAENLTGNSHLASAHQSLLAPSVDSHTIDLRRLGDRFRDETHTLIALYSPQEERFFFVNNAVKSLMGWSPEKFNKTFFELIQEGHLDWKHALKLLSKQEESRTRLVMSTKSGEDVLVHCHLGKIKKGVFTEQVIAIMYAD